ncbi:MAG: hypothetical protein J5I59_12120 [Saprospiraceae bacterium]|nr:hypothetical protein [Saprospiraceae bacterium]
MKFHFLANSRLFILLSMIFQLFISCKQDNYNDTSGNINDSDTLYTSEMPVQEEHFDKILPIDSGNLYVRTTGDDELKHLNLTLDLKDKKSIAKSIAIDGDISNALTADLNNDGIQELYIFNQSAGSGSYGQLFAFQVNGGRMDSIIMDDIPAKYLDKYMGHDSFAISENHLIRSFPLYNIMDPNCCPTGGKKILKYKLIKHAGQLRLQLANK